MIEKRNFSKWFQQIWNLPGASLKYHPVPYPLELAARYLKAESADLFTNTEF